MGAWRSPPPSACLRGRAGCGGRRRRSRSGSARASTSPKTNALLETIKKFEAKTGIKVELSQYAIQDMIPKTVAALDSGTVPDVAYSDTYERAGAGQVGVRGKLEDLSDILLPMKSAFAPNTLETAFLLNDITKEARLLTASR